MRIQGADIGGFRVDLTSVTGAAHSRLTALSPQTREEIVASLNGLCRALHRAGVLPLLPDASAERRPQSVYRSGTADGEDGD